MVLSHHERPDGKGYPNGLSGDEMPIGARIIAVADAFDSMTADRVYRKAMSPDEALSEIVRQRGIQFHPVEGLQLLDDLDRVVVPAGEHRDVGPHPLRAGGGDVQRGDRASLPLDAAGDVADRGGAGGELEADGDGVADRRHR